MTACHRCHRTNDSVALYMGKHLCRDCRIVVKRKASAKSTVRFTEGRTNA